MPPEKSVSEGPTRSRASRAWRAVLRGALLASAALAVPVACRMATVYRFDLGSCPAPAGGLTSRPAGGPALPVELTVLSYNVMGRGALLDGGHVEELALAITALQPDVVGLQEVHVRTWQARFHDQLGELAARTGLAPAFGGSFSELGGAFGNGMLVRGEVLSTEVVPLPSFGEPRSLLRCTVAVRGAVLDVLVTHLAPWGGLASRVRAAQVRCVAAVVAGGTRPTVLAADLNAPPGAAALAPLLGGGLLGLDGSTAPTFRLTDEKLDYVLVRGGVEVRGARVVDAGPSDHRPLLVRLGPPAGGRRG